METLKFKTNINCTGCLSNVTPVLDQEKDIENWEVDLNSEDRVLTVKSNGLSKAAIIQKINKAGYVAEEY
jgi:copper chaperone CopZ